MSLRSRVRWADWHYQRADDPRAYRKGRDTVGLAVTMLKRARCPFPLSVAQEWGGSSTYKAGEWGKHHTAEEIQAFEVWIKEAEAKCQITGDSTS